MKLKIALILVLLFSLNSFSQKDDWGTYDVDSLVSIDMPGDVYEIDTIIMEKKMYFLDALKDSSRFFVGKMYLDPTYSDMESIVLPYNEKSLEQLYTDMIGSFLELSAFEFDERRPVTRYGLLGRKTYFVDSNDKPVGEADLVYVNHNLYLFFYTNFNKINRKEKDNFFGSIAFNTDYELLQYHENPNSIWSHWIWQVGIFLFIMSFLARFWSKRKQSKNDY